MESVKRRKLKFPCFFGDNGKSPRCRTVQSWTPSIATTEQSLFKFEVGKGTSKQHNVKSARKCSPSILAKLMGRGGHSSARSIHKQQKRLSDSSSKNASCPGGQKNDDRFHHKAVCEDSEASDVAYEHHSLQLGGTHDKHTKLPTEVRFHRCKRIDDRGTVKTMDSRMKEGFESGRVNVFEYGYLGDESLHVPTSISASESEVITTHSRITIHQNDRLTYSQFNMSEPSLIREAKNRMLERWKMTNCVQDDVGMVSKGRTLGEMFSSTDKETRTAESERVVGVVGVGVNNVFDSLLGSRSTSFLSSIYDPNDKMNVCHKDDADEKVVVYSKPLNRDRRKDLPYEKVRHNERCHSSQCSNMTGTRFGNYIAESNSGQKSIEPSVESDGLAKHQSFISCIGDVATSTASSCDAVVGCEIEMSPEISKNLNPNLARCMLGDATFSGADENKSKSSQLSRPESEYSERLKDVDHNDPVLEAPPSEDISSDSDCLERLNSRLQDLKQQLHLLKVESTFTSNNLTPTRKIKPLSQLSSVATSYSAGRESSFMAPILQASEIYDIASDTFSPPWETTHHPTDPMIYYHLEKYYFGGANILLKPEKRLLYDYIEQTYIRTSKLMVAYPWVRPEKRESQFILAKLNFEDQIRKVINEIGKEDEENFLAISYDKNPEWLQPTNEVDILGNLVAELVLHDLLLEVVNF